MAEQAEYTAADGKFQLLMPLGGLFGFARLRRDNPAATVSGPAVEQINEVGHQAGANA